MKVMLICTQLEAGGAQRASVRLADELLKQGYDCSNWFLYKKREAFKDSNHIFSILERPIKSSVDYLKISLKLYKVLRREKPDAVVTFTHYANVLGLIVARFAGVKIRVASHRNPSWGDMSKGLMAVDKFCAVTHTYTAITAVSESTKATFDYYPEKIFKDIKVIKNGLTYKRSTLTKAEARQLFNLPADAAIIGTIGRLSYQKNQKLLIESIKDTDIHLVIIGDGELKDDLLALVASLNVGPQVHFLGEISGDKVPHYLQALDMYVMPSLFEGLSNALVEALCSGKPTLASDIPSQRDVIIGDDGKHNGLLLPTDNAAAWTAAYHNLLTDTTMYNDYAQRALVRAADFTMEKMTNGFKAVIHPN